MSGGGTVAAQPESASAQTRWTYEEERDVSTRPHKQRKKTGENARECTAPQCPYAM